MAIVLWRHRLKFCPPYSWTFHAWCSRLCVCHLNAQVFILATARGGVEGHRGHNSHCEMQAYPWFTSLFLPTAFYDSQKVPHF